MTVADWFGLLALVVIGLAVASVAIAVSARRRRPADEADSVLWKRLTHRVEVLERGYSAMWAALNESLRGIRILTGQLVDNHIEPAWTPPEWVMLGNAPAPAPTPGQTPAIDETFEALRTRFSLDELEIVAHDAGLDYERIGARGLPLRNAALKVYEAAERSGKLVALADAVRKARGE